MLPAGSVLTFYRLGPRLLRLLLIGCDLTDRFGDDIPGMEGLGTGEFASGFLE